MAKQRLGDLDPPQQFELHLSSIQAALEGDAGPLADRLRDIACKLSVADAAVLRFAADMLEGKVKRPAHRPPLVATQIRQREIARYVHELCADGASKKTAIDKACAAFDCGRSTVADALAANPYLSAGREVLR